MTDSVDQVIKAAWKRRTDERGFYIGDKDSIEHDIAEATGLSWLRVTKGMDRLYLIRAYRLNPQTRRTRKRLSPK